MLKYCSLYLNIHSLYLNQTLNKMLHIQNYNFIPSKILIITKLSNFANNKGPTLIAIIHLKHLPNWQLYLLQSTDQLQLSNLIRCFQLETVN